jgi:uncharacterized membrane protein
MNLSEKAESKQTSRIEAISDGVFAIALTLLVLDIRIPSAKDGEPLLQALLQEWPIFLAFIVGFFTILICWINHHYMFECIHKSNGMLLLLNGFKLLVVSLTPFATALLAKYLLTPHLRLAACVYAGNFALMGLSMAGIWFYSVRQGFMQTMSPQVLKASTQLYFMAGIFSVSIFIASFFSTIVALVLSGIMFTFFIFPKSSIKALVNLAPQKPEVAL